MNGDNDQKPKTQPGLHLPSWVWWVVMIALLAWLVLGLLPTGQTQVSIPYSAFLDQVRAGNVSEVKITSDTITGTFVKQVLWPPATPVASSTPGAQATATAAAALQPPEPYTEFTTNFPSTVGDSSLMPLLQSQNVVVNVSPPPNPLLSTILSTVLPMLLLVGLIWWIGRGALRGQGGAMDFGRSRARRYTGELTRVTFDDVAGADEAKKDLEQVVDFLKNPSKYHDIGAHIPKGTLLVGPPGTGKTLMARAIAGEANVPFFSLSGSEFVEMFVGVGASRVRDLFEKAQQAAPAIVFIDELDAVGRRRGAGLGNTNDEREQTLNQLLVEMDGFDERHEVIVLAATNRPDVLDPALLRPGRFDRQITIPLPDRKGRVAILQIHTRHLELESDVDLSVLAGITTGFSGADLANLCNEAALIAASKDQTTVNMNNFEEAIDKVVLGGERKMLLNESDRRLVANHESGHTVVAWLSPEADPVHKVTIIPRGQALGVTEQLPGEDQYNYSRGYLMARLAVMLGGRSAEEEVIGDITTGAESDLIQATRLAHRMVTRWGMGSLGPIAFQSDEQQPFLGYELSQGRDYSELTAAHIDQEVQRMIEERHQVARKVIKENRDKLDKLVEALLREETVEHDELEKLLGPRPEGAVESANAMEIHDSKEAEPADA